MAQLPRLSGVAGSARSRGPAVGISKAVLNHDGSVGKHYGAWVCGCTSRVVQSRRLGARAGNGLVAALHPPPPLARPRTPMALPHLRSGDMWAWRVWGVRWLARVALVHRPLCHCAVGLQARALTRRPRVRRPHPHPPAAHRVTCHATHECRLSRAVCVCHARCGVAPWHAARACHVPTQCTPTTPAACKNSFHKSIKKILRSGQEVTVPTDKRKRLFWCFAVGMDPQSVGRGRGYRGPRNSSNKPDRACRPFLWFCWFARLCPPACLAGRRVVCALCTVPVVAAGGGMAPGGAGGGGGGGGRALCALGSARICSVCSRVCLTHARPRRSLLQGVW